MAQMKELDRIAKVVAEDMLEQLHENVHWSMPEVDAEGDEYLELHNYVMTRAIYYISKELDKDK